MTDQDRIRSLTSELALTLGLAIGCAHKHKDYDTICMLLAGEFARELAEKEPDRLIGMLMRTYGPERGKHDDATGL